MNSVSRRRKPFRFRARGRRFKVHRNPKHHSAAMRAKISRAVKASMRRRKSSGPTRRRSIRRSAPAAVAFRRRNRRPTFAVARRNRRSSRRLTVVRSRRRRSSSRRGFSLGGLNLRSILSKDNLIRAGGVVGSSFLTNLVLGQFGSKLPGYTNTWVRVGYAVAIPVVGAFVVKRFSPRLSEGMLLGGLATAIAELLNRSGIAQQITPAPAATTGTGEYFHGYLDNTRPSNSPGYSAINSFSASPSAYDSQPAFGDAWGR